MTCFRPITAWQNPKADLTIPSQLYYDFKKISFKEKKDWLKIQIPCGRCLGCVLDNAADWATRLYMENKTWKNAIFLTLTYNNKNLPKTINGESTLVKEDFTNFIKKLRKNYTGIEEWEHPIKKTKEKPIRFYAVGEYGTNANATFRPHYHAIIFNFKPNDLKYYKPNKYGDKIYTSKEIQNLWGKGFITIEDVNYTTACYVARYVQKKAYKQPKKLIKTGEIEPKIKIDERNGQEFIHYIQKRKYEDNIIEKEFSLMSRGAGIGLKYFMNNKETIIKDNGIWVKQQQKLKLMHIPRYFKKLFNKSDWEKFEEWNYKNKKNGEQNKKELIEKISNDKIEELNYDKFLQKQEIELKKKIHKRNSII